MSTTGVEFVHYQNGLFVTLIDSPAWRYDTMLPRGYLQLLRRPSSIYESCPETSTRNITRNLDRDNLAPRGQPMATCLYVFTCTCALEIFRFQLQSVDDIYISMYALVPVDSVSFWKFALAPFIPDHLGDNCAISPPLSKISYRWLNKRISARPPVPVSGLRPRPEPPWWRPMETAPGRSILLPTPPPPRSSLPPCLPPSLPWSPAPTWKLLALIQRYMNRRSTISTKKWESAGRPHVAIWI